jgi:threonine 3-dehydrogenase
MPTTMQAVVKAHAAPGIELREVPVPTPGPGEVQVRVEAVSVCGTDLHSFRATNSPALWRPSAAA